jgi:hypothetical protein
MASRVFRVVLIVLTTFLALTAFAGGIGLMADLNAPSLGMLEGSLFHNYIVPGLALFEIVEIMAIGSPPGIARDLQIFYFTLGSPIVAFSIAFRVATPAGPRPTQATSA